MTDWIASGPDEFGDFHVSSKGEQLAKCVVIQNGFRTPEETKAIASQVIAAVNNHEALKAENDRLRSELEQAKGQVEKPVDLRTLVDWVYLYATEGEAWLDRETVSDLLIELARSREPKQLDANWLRTGATLKQLLSQALSSTKLRSASGDAE